MDQHEFTSSSEADTDQFGAAIAAVVQPGDVIALNGDLGAGKTRLVRAIVIALDGAEARVNSPTFVIVQRYDVKLPVYHIDTYRLADVDEFLALGAEEIFGGDGLCLIEWAERVAEVLPDDRLTIDITATAPHSRVFRLSAIGPRGSEMIARLRTTSDGETVG